MTILVLGALLRTAALSGRILPGIRPRSIEVHLAASHGHDMKRSRGSRDIVDKCGQYLWQVLMKHIQHIQHIPAKINCPVFLQRNDVNFAKHTPFVASYKYSFQTYSKKSSLCHFPSQTGHGVGYLVIINGCQTHYIMASCKGLL